MVDRKKGKWERVTRKQLENIERTLQIASTGFAFYWYFGIKFCFSFRGLALPALIQMV